MPTGQAEIGAAVIGDRIYVVGGYQYVHYAYDPVTNSWSTIATPPTPTFSFPAVFAFINGQPVLLGIFGIGCDAELTPDEVLARLATVAGAGGLCGARGLTGPVADRMEVSYREKSRMRVVIIRWKQWLILLAASRVTVITFGLFNCP